VKYPAAQAGTLSRAGVASAAFGPADIQQIKGLFPPLA
jgi:hypothetical protein